MIRKIAQKKMAWEKKYECNVRNGLDNADRSSERNTSITFYMWSKEMLSTLGSCVFSPAC